MELVKRETMSAWNCKYDHEREILTAYILDSKNDRKAGWNEMKISVIDGDTFVWN